MHRNILPSAHFAFGATNDLPSAQQNPRRKTLGAILGDPKKYPNFFLY
jgi:hypothetical protein